jgi:hypothetical protein
LKIGCYARAKVDLKEMKSVNKYENLQLLPYQGGEPPEAVAMSSSVWCYLVDLTYYAKSGGDSYEGFELND